MRCAQRGCKLPHDATTAEGAMCPVCNNPLIVVMEEGDEALAEELRREEEARKAMAAQLALAGVSQEQPPVIGADGLPIPAVA